MGKTTVSRQLRLTVDAILAAKGIEDLQLSIDLTAACIAVYESKNPAQERIKIADRIASSLANGARRYERLAALRGELEKRLNINPNGREWDDFIEFADKQEGQPLSKFLDWWLSDEWRRTHPPANPKNFYVYWPQAFTATGHPLGLRVEV